MNPLSTNESSILLSLITKFTIAARSFLKMAKFYVDNNFIIKVTNSGPIKGSVYFLSK